MVALNGAPKMGAHAVAWRDDRGFETMIDEACANCVKAPCKCPRIEYVLDSGGWDEEKIVDALFFSRVKLRAVTKLYGVFKMRERVSEHPVEILAKFEAA